MRTLTSVVAIGILTACGQTKSNQEITTVVATADQIKRRATTMKDIYPSLDHAHPNARILMSEEWYYSPIDDMAPFGSDDAADTYTYFHDWRQTNKNASPKTFVLRHFKHWEYPQIDLETTDYERIKPFLEQNELGSRYLFGMDAAIVATALGQLYLEGKIDPDIKEFARTAISRELQPQILNRWDHLTVMREKKLNDFMRILNSCK